MKPAHLSPILLLLALSITWAADASAGVEAPARVARTKPAATAPAPAAKAVKPRKEEAPEPPLFTASYTVHANGFKVGEMDRSLKALGNDTYLVETKVRTTGIVSLFKPDEYVERSVLQSTPEGYVPLEFSSRYTGRYKDVVERVRFDWDRLRAESLRDGKTKEVRIEPGVLDKLMYQVVLQYELSRGETAFRYRVADRGKIEEYEMEVVGEETVKTALGEHRAIKVKKGTTMIWCVPELDYLPVKLEQREDGNTIATHIQTLNREAPVAVTSSLPPAP